jgi:hypothetical protein
MRSTWKPPFSTTARAAYRIALGVAVAGLAQLLPLHLAYAKRPPVKRLAELCYSERPPWRGRDAFRYARDGDLSEARAAAMRLHETAGRAAGELLQYGALAADAIKLALAEPDLRVPVHVDRAGRARRTGVWREPRVHYESYERTQDGHVAPGASGVWVTPGTPTGVATEVALEQYWRAGDGGEYRPHGETRVRQATVFLDRVHAAGGARTMSIPEHEEPAPKNGRPAFDVWGWLPLMGMEPREPLPKQRGWYEPLIRLPPDKLGAVARAIRHPVVAVRAPEGQIGGRGTVHFFDFPSASTEIPLSRMPPEGILSADRVAPGPARWLGAQAELPPVAAQGPGQEGRANEPTRAKRRFILFDAVR